MLAYARDMVAMTILGLVAAAGAGCVDDPATITYAECVCDDDACGPSYCSFELSLHPNCDGDVEFAEVLVDAHVEEELLVAGETFTPCTRIEPGSKATVWVRGGSWIWGPLERDCHPGQEHSLVLQCSEG